MRLLHSIAVVLVVGFCSLTSSAQVPSGLFRARVVDTNGKTISSVSFVFESPNFTRRVNSTPAGTLGIRLPPGVYRVALSKVGFADNQLSGVAIRRGGYVAYVFTLKPSAAKSSFSWRGFFASATHNKSLDRSHGKRLSHQA